MGKPYEELWDQTGVRGRVVGTVHKVIQKDEWKLDHAFAGAKNTCDGGSEITITKHVNGSGNEYFGGAREWPAVTLTVSLPVKREDLAQDLAKLLRETVAKFVCDNDLRDND